MKLKTEYLAKHLSERLLPVYLVSGDETLLIQETCDQIRSAAKDKGFTDRELMHGEPGDVDTLLFASETMSLFAEQKAYEFRLLNAPTADFSKAFLSWCENPPEDQFLLISCAKLDKKAKNKAWYKKLEQLGVHIEIWPIDAKELPSWLAMRAKMKGLKLDSEAIQVFADRIEGNLLAAQQEVERLSLLYADSGSITADMMREYVGDNSRFNSFELLEASFTGDAKRLTRILTGLKLEGEAVARINGLLTYELRNLTKMAWDCSQGEQTSRVLQKYHVWGPKKVGYGKSLKRYPVRVWHRLLARCLELDKIIKGQQIGEPWEAMETLLLQIAGHSLWKVK